MNIQQALKRMIAPSQKRPVWRGGIIQIHITRACDRACFHCTQGSNLRGKPVMITPELFEEACRSLKGYWGVIGVFGGNPAIHPKFEEICSILRKYFPKEQRGLWCNNPLGKGEIMRKTFNPYVSNLNVHTNMDAWNEFVRDWPECARVLKGEHESRHSPPLVAMKDKKQVKSLPHWDREGVRVPNTEANRWELISRCDINQFWSAMVCYVPGKGLRAFFCEIAGMMAMLHADNPKWKDLGMEAKPGWWKKSMKDFASQAKYYCHQCGIPLKIRGELEQSGDRELISETHQDICKPKDDRPVELVQIESVQFYHKDELVTNYIENGELA
jgi:hypothetical protein